MCKLVHTHHCYRIHTYISTIWKISLQNENMNAIVKFLEMILFCLVNGWKYWIEMVILFYYSFSTAIILECTIRWRWVSFMHYIDGLLFVVAIDTKAICKFSFCEYGIVVVLIEWQCCELLNATRYKRTREKHWTEHNIYSKFELKLHWMTSGSCNINKIQFKISLTWKWRCWTIAPYFNP